MELLGETVSVLAEAVRGIFGLITPCDLPSLGPEDLAREYAHS